MEAYLNELSVKAFSNNKDAQDAFSLLGRCLSKMSELGVSNVRMTNEAMGKGMLPGQTWNRILNNETVIDKDLKSVLIAKLCTLEPTALKTSTTYWVSLIMGYHVKVWDGPRKQWKIRLL